jgi:hypothetical protein
MAPSPPALIRLDSNLVGLGGALAVLPLALASGIGVGAVLSVFWSGVWGSTIRALVASIPRGVGVLSPALAEALGSGIEAAASLGVLALGVGFTAMALDELRRRLRPWDPEAASWFERGHRVMVAGTLTVLYLGESSAAVTALLVPLAVWACRPAARPGESARAALQLGTLTVMGFGLGQLAAALYTTLGPVPGGFWNHLAMESLSRTEVYRLVYLPFLKASLGDTLGRFLATGLFLAPATAYVARVIRRALPEAPRLAVSTLGFLPALVLCWQTARTTGLLGGYPWFIDTLREVSLAAPIASIQLWMVLGWAGTVVLPHLVAAGWGAGAALPEPEAPAQLPAEPQPTAPGGLVFSKTSLASS